MPWISAIIVLLLVFRPLNLELRLAHFVKPVHTACLATAPETVHREWYQAIVCGKSLPSSTEKSWFQQSGLIHIIVVSGSHLVFLDSLLAALMGRSRAALVGRGFLLLLFSLASNLQPPITRALIQRGWQAFFASRNSSKSALFLQLLSGFSTLAVFPQWWTSLSFLMSWICALALSVPIAGVGNGFVRAAFVYLLMLPALLPLQMPHPATILFNTLFAPILGLGLFPLSLLAFAHASVATFVDQAWSLLFALFAVLPLPESDAGTPYALTWLIVYLLLAQAGGFAWSIYEKRRHWPRSL